MEVIQQLLHLALEKISRIYASLIGMDGAVIDMNPTPSIHIKRNLLEGY